MPKQRVLGICRATVVGNPDYCINIDHAVIPIAGHHQGHNIGTAVLTVPVVAYPNFYTGVFLFYDPDLNVVLTIPENPGYFINDIHASGDTNALTLVAAQIYDTLVTPGYTDIVSGLVATLALKIAPKVADINFTRGLPLAPYVGKYFVLAFAHYSVGVNTTLNVYMNYTDDLLTTKTVPGGI